MDFRFESHIVDTELPPGMYAQTALADLDGDGRPEFITGQQYGTIFWYKCHAPDRWSRFVLGHDSPSDVGGCALDVDGDGLIDFVAGGAWYRNSQEEGRPFERIVFDPELRGVHDLLAADIDGDGRLEIVTMSDKNSLRWYKIPDGDGDFDLLSCEMEAVGGQRPPRWYIWENLDGKGGAWKEHAIFDANLGGHEAVVGDVTGNGKPDVVSKPWRARPDNGVGGKTYVVFLENVSP